MENNTLRTQENKEKTMHVVEQLATEDTLQSMEDTINIVRQEYGNYKITKEMRKELEKEFGVDSTVSNGWEKVSDILDHIDVYEVVKRHPEAMGKVARSIASVIGLFFGPVGTIAHNIPDELAAKIIGFAGILTPEHWLNVIAKAQVNRTIENRKQELLELEEQFKTAENEKLLIVVYQDEVLFEQLRNLVETEDDEEGVVVGTTDHSIKIVSWTKKMWKNNSTDPRLNTAKILFVGNAEGTEHLNPVIDKKFEKFGVSYGWAGNKAIINANEAALENKKNYTAFLSELKKLPLPEAVKNGGKIGGTAKTVTTVAATLLLGPIGTAGSLIGMHTKDKKNLTQQMFLYGIVNLYNNDLESFMNS